MLGLEWRPFERLVLQQILPLPEQPTHLLLDLHLEDVAGGTRLTSGGGADRTLPQAGPGQGDCQDAEATDKRELERLRDAIQVQLSERRTTPPPSAPDGQAIRRQAVASLEQND